MKIGIIGYYYNIEFFKSISDAFIELGYMVDFFPLLYYHHSGHKNLESHFALFLDNVSSDEKIVVSPGKINVLLWMCYNAPVEIFKMAHTKEIHNVLFNHGDPYESFECNAFCNKLQEKCKYLDMVFTVSKLSIPFYEKYGVKYVYHTSLGYDPKYHFLSDSTVNYTTDVSFIISNLYMDNGFGIDRKKLLDKITNIPDITVRIYGPSTIKNYFPNHHVEQISWEHTRDIYMSSKININTHKVINNGSALNKRTYQIMASGGLMLMDVPSNDFFTANMEYICLDYDNIETQIRTILADYNQTNISDIKKNACYKISDYTYKLMVTNFIQKINSKLNFKLQYAIRPGPIMDNIREIIDKYEKSEEIQLLLQLLYLSKSNGDILHQIQLFANEPDIKINSEVNNFIKNIR